MDYPVLRSALERFWGDGVLVRQLMRFAMMPMMEDGGLHQRDRGIPQGSPLGPLFCNVYFHELDLYIESRGMAFLRYADDIVLFANDRASLAEAVEKVGEYMTDRLKLTINRRKSAMDAPLRLKYLGCRFMADRNGILVLDQSESVPAACHAWHSRSIQNPGRTYHILSDGILRQRDYSLLMEAEERKEDIPIGYGRILSGSKTEESI